MARNQRRERGRGPRNDRGGSSGERGGGGSGARFGDRSAQRGGSEQRGTVPRTGRFSREHAHGAGAPSGANFFEDSQAQFERSLSHRLKPDDFKRLAQSTALQLQEMLSGSKKNSADFVGIPVAAPAAGTLAFSPEPAATDQNSQVLPSTPDRGWARAQQRLAGPHSTVEPSASGRQPLVPSTDYRSRSQPLHKKPQQKNVPRPAEDAPAPALSALLAVNVPARPAGSVPLDAWQAEALDALLNGMHLVVDAPTSAGKTRVIEALLDEKMKQGLKLIYTSPVKSLSNDKYREFCEKYGREAVGINTGDFKENLGAPIILATLETYRNSLLGVEPDMARKVVVFDEYHFLQDESRGSAWEESMILTPKESQLVLLSASVPNASDFAEWIEFLTKRKTKVIHVAKRPVPLVDLVYTSQGWVLGDDLQLLPQEILQLQGAGKKDKDRFKRGKEAYQTLMPAVGAALEMGLGPLVLYAGRRADVEGLATAVAKHLRGDFTGPEADKLRARLEDLPGWAYVPTELQRLVRRQGIAYHHSGLIPPGRVAIESLLKEGLLRVCTGTMGISLGVNFAVRSALVFDESRPSEGGDTRYSSTEIMQMLGRAGRRGHDTQGFSLWSSLARFASQKPRGREECKSSLKFDPSTVLGILGQHESFARLSEFYKKSFFMRGKPVEQVLVQDHELLTATLYKEHNVDSVPCNDIPETYLRFQQGKQRSKVLCTTCPARPACHPLVAAAGASVLSGIVNHLQKVKALDGPKPTKLGQLARHFPQAGGLIIASWIASGQMNGSNFRQYLQAMSVFCSAHFKDIADIHADVNFLKELEIPKLIAHFYPDALFPELYDDLDKKGGFRNRNKGEGLVFREFNPGTASIITCWIDQEAPWDDLVAEHTSKYFSAGDCMMVLFRFATFLQSCARIAAWDAAIAAKARALLSVVLREPLDARNRMLAEEVSEQEAKVEVAGQLQDAPPVIEGA